MAFKKFNKDMKIISALDDEPNDVGGLTAAELKAKFDEGGEAIKRYLNDTLIPAVVADGATEEHRAAAEAARVAAEQTRQSNEKTRQANETLRISAENARNVWENYDASKAYAVGNKAAYGGSSYLCIKPCTGIAPPSAEYWLLIAKKGDKGEPGGGAGQPVMRIDLTSDVTIETSNLWTIQMNFASGMKATCNKIRDAVRAGGAYVTVMLEHEAKDGTLRFPATLQMFGTSCRVSDDATEDDSFDLTGTYSFALITYDIRIGCDFGDKTGESVYFWKQVTPWIGKGPIFDPRDETKPDTTPDGAFLRLRNKQWVAETVPTAEGGTF